MISGVFQLTSLAFIRIDKVAGERLFMWFFFFQLSALAAHQVAGALVYFAEDDAAGDCDSSVPMIPTVMYGDPFSPGTVTNGKIIIPFVNNTMLNL